ncbi:MAG TPA: hypothetical protein DCZ75_17210 [Geobacter sp.]|nr:hypothetical protein [Geobacter sp.]
MRNPGMSKLHYLLYALLIFALTGCGASKMGNLTGGTGNEPGSVASKLVWSQSKTTAKTAAVVVSPASVASIEVTVTGTAAAGGPIPLVKTTSTTTTGFTVGGIYPGKVTVAVKALDASSAVLYEGYAIGVTVDSGSTTDITGKPIVMSPPVVKAQDTPCIGCHERTLDSTGQNLVAEFKQSGHYTNTSFTDTKYPTAPLAGCAGCHGPSHNDFDPAGSGRCADCHVPTLTKTGADGHHLNKYVGSDTTVCATCHNPHNPLGPFVGGSCVKCHAFPQDKTAHGDYVDDNNGVRVITTEFAKWSHHVTGVTLNDAHCAACHLEGKISNGQVIIDTTKHMADAKTHLRNGDTDADYAWDPATPDHSLMDNFCLSCHDSNGATSSMSAQIQAFINTNGLAATGKTASATNPFGDTISNRYDKMQRPAVVDAKGQFDLTNPSHHAVLGQKYTGRTRTAGARQIANAAAFAANSSAGLPGARTTIYDSRAIRTNSATGNPAYNVSKFEATYETLSPAPGTTDKTLGDDSVLHCGDCHTVGQYRQADVGVLPRNNAVIGAHGSNNEYLLRNSLGTDERHVGQTYSSASGVNYFTNPTTQPWLVCFNCHSYQNYGSIGNATGANGTNHAGEYANSTRCNGPVNTISFIGYTTSVNDTEEPYAFRLGLGQRDGITTGSTSTNDTDFSNIFGIQCANCHNAGPNNLFGGIHGSKVKVYTDANGAQQKAYRFLPGLGNTMYVPGNASGTAAGVGSVSDLNWEVKSISTKYDAGKTAVIDNGGCYTLVPESDDGLNLTTTASYSKSPAFEQTVDQPAAGTHIFGTWGGCDDHRGNAHGKAFANTAAPYDGGTVPTGGAGVVRKALRPVSY